MLLNDDLKEIVLFIYEKNKRISRDMEVVSERVRKLDGEKDSFAFFRDKSYLGWEGLFISSQSDLPIPSLMYELMRVLITVLMMIYIYMNFR